jgi:hypothetical protein
MKYSRLVNVIQVRREEVVRRPAAHLVLHLV